MPMRIIEFQPTECAESRDRERSCRSSDARTRGRLAAELQQVRQEVAALKASLAEIVRMRHEARGGWRAAAFLFPVVSALCAAAALFLKLHQ